MDIAQNVIRDEVADYLLDMWWLAIRSSHEKANKEILLTSEEALAVYAYTNCRPPYYQEINNALRDGEDHYMVELIDSALAKLPPETSSVVHRWAIIPGQEIEELRAGNIVTNLGYTSTNREPNRFEECEYGSDSMRIFQHLGRDISLYSDDNSPGLVEVLIPRNSTFKLMGENGTSGFEFDFIQLS